MLYQTQGNIACITYDGKQVVLIYKARKNQIMFLCDVSKKKKNIKCQ